jgi:hypothetical protein
MGKFLGKVKLNIGKRRNWNSYGGAIFFKGEAGEDNFSSFSRILK